MVNYFITQLKYLVIYIKLKNKIKKKSLDNNYSKKIILCELNNFSSFQIPVFYFLNYFLHFFPYEIRGYYNYSVIKHSIEENYFIFFLRKYVLNIIIKKIYKLFNVKNFIYPRKVYDQTKVKKYHNIIVNLKSKKKLTNFKIQDILIGDLIYDTYCKKFGEPTLNFDDKRFSRLVRESINQFYFWLEYFKNNPNIKKVISSHAVYSYGIILRIALKFNTEVYLISLDRIKKLNKRFPFEVHHKDYDLNKFNKLDLKKRKKIYLRGKYILDNVLKGNEKSFNIVSTLKKNSFLKKKKKSMIKKNNKIKILISPHDFYDAPHCWGDHVLFSDYYEWLKYIYDLSIKTNYDWYIKTHPDLVGKLGVYQRKSRVIIDEMFNNQKNVTILPPNYSNYRIVKDKIDFIITCHGSVAYEFPYFKIPTITCSESNPFINCKFNIHAKSKKHLKYIIFNLKKFKKNSLIKKEEIYKYFANRFVFYNTNNWLFNFFEYANYLKGWYRRDGPELYDYWLKNYEKMNTKKINLTIDKYIKSGDILMNKEHIN